MYLCRRDREDRDREIKEAEEREALKNMTEAERRAWEAAHPKVCHLSMALLLFMTHCDMPALSTAPCSAMPAPAGASAAWWLWQAAVQRALICAAAVRLPDVSQDTD